MHRMFLLPAVAAAVAVPGADLLRSALGGLSLESLQEALVASKALPLPLNTPDSQWCPNNSYWEFLPVTVAQVIASAPSASWAGDGCFTGMSMQATFGSGSVSVTLSGSNPTGLLCSDAYMIATSTQIQVAIVSALAPTTTVTINATSPADALDVSVNGINAHLLPCGVTGTLASVLKTVSLFQGNASELVSSNVDFLVERHVWPSATPFGKVVTVDASAIRSGDYLAVARLDGLDPMVEFGTGGATGHSAIAVWDQGTLYVCESTDANPLGPVYWPPPYGIIKHEYSTWVTLAQAAAYHVMLLPLAPEYSAVFNETAFWSWFNLVQGEPYGYHTMLFSFLDTYAPFANMPQPVSATVVTPVLNALDTILGNATHGVTVFSMFTWGLNKRMNASCSNLACIINLANMNKAAGRPLASFVEVAAQPDEDDWKFGANYSMVCSEFAAHGWKVGLADAFPVWNSILANEQTPKDNYQMAIFDPSHFTQANCPGGVTTAQGGNGAYCQIMGQFVVSLGNYNTVPLYAGMNNACPSQWPDYVRCPPGNNMCC